MKLTYAVIAVLLATGSSASLADSRNPFDPASAKAGVRRVSTTSSTHAAVKGAAMQVGELPAIVLPPPLPPPMARTPQSEVPRLLAEGKEPVTRAKPKESAMQLTAASCKIKVKSDSVAAPAYGGLVSIAMQGGTRDCVSAVLVEQDWLEAKELSDPSVVKVAVDANDSSSPRQSNIVIANAGQSVTVTLVQEGRSPRNR